VRQKWWWGPNHVCLPTLQQLAFFKSPTLAPSKVCCAAVLGGIHSCLLDPRQQQLVKNCLKLHAAGCWWVHMQARGIQRQSCHAHEVHIYCICVHHMYSQIKERSTLQVPCKQVAWECLVGLWHTSATVGCSAQTKSLGPVLLILLLHMVCDCVWCVDRSQSVCARHVSAVYQPFPRHVTLGVGCNFLHTAVKLGQSHASCGAAQPHCKYTLPTACKAS
jgi:hypothetical protein